MAKAIGYWELVLMWWRDEEIANADRILNDSELDALFVERIKRIANSVYVKDQTTE